MTTKELYSLIKRHAANGYISGRKLLEFITDVPGFVSLLGGFYRIGTYHRVSFIAKYPKPINTILNDNVTFYADFNVLGIWHGHEYFSNVYEV
jgi:hypothetical protein